MNLFHLENGLYWVQSGVLPKNVDTNYSFLYLLSLIMCERVEKNNCINKPCILGFRFRIMKNNIKKAPVKFWEDLLYFQHFMQIFCFCSKLVIITTLNAKMDRPMDEQIIYIKPISQTTHVSKYLRQGF